MTRLGGRLAIGLAAAALLTAGGVTASALQDAPRDARPSAGKANNHAAPGKRPRHERPRRAPSE